ncbi:DUF445 family protein [Clostridium neuense]|uniref:DUF445 family protein n=1 Tax=Clostridium neuense TaxID=1728934 RepID=A0ABW8TJB3_9CLOT
MKSSNRYKATVILIIFGVGYFISGAFKDNFFGGLISSMCSAALIGGLADWFGVTAIFGKPLGINWPKKVFRTDILRNSKEKFILTIRDMVVNDLLNKDKINKKIEQYDFYNEIWKIPVIQDKEKLSYIADEIAEKVDVNKIVVEAAKGYYDDTKLINYTYTLLKHMIKSPYYSKTIDYVCDEISMAAQSDIFAGFTGEMLNEVVKKYKIEKGEESFSDKFLYNFVLNPQILSDSIEKKILKYMNKIKEDGSEEREKLDKFILEFIESIKVDEKVKMKIVYLKELLINNLGSLKIDFKGDELYSKLKETSINKIEELKENDSVRQEFNTFIRNFVINIVDKRHSEIGKVVEESLNKFDSDEIINLAYDKFGDDLQIIRINGSLVGGLVGIVIFLISYL